MLAMKFAHFGQTKKALGQTVAHSQGTFNITAPLGNSAHPVKIPVRVRITQVRYDYVYLKMDGHGTAKQKTYKFRGMKLFSSQEANQQSPRKFLAITLNIKNISDRRILYGLWNPLGNGVFPVLSDRKQVYSPVVFQKRVPRGAPIKPLTLSPGHSVKDILVFNCRPHGQRLHLRLPGPAVGMDAPIRLEFRAK